MICAEQRSYGTSVEGRPLRVLSIGDAAGHAARRPALFLASIHGDEPVGTPLLHRFVERLKQTGLPRGAGAVSVVPAANPDGLAAGTRNNARGIDLNRNFPAGNFDARSEHGALPLCEPESRALHDLVLALRPRLVVSIHQPYGCLDYDGPGRDLAARMAAASDLELKRVGSRAGSLGSWVGLTLGFPIATVEFRAGDHEVDAAVFFARYEPMLLAALRAASVTPAD